MLGRVILCSLTTKSGAKHSKFALDCRYDLHPRANAMRNIHEYCRRVIWSSRCKFLKPGIAFAHFTAAITCRPPNMLSVVMIRHEESGTEGSYPAYNTSGSMTSSRDTRVGVSCGNVAGTTVLLGFSEVSWEPPAVAC